MPQLKLYSWNVNGIRAVIRKHNFEPFIATHDPDILCLQETKAERGQAEIDLPQYEEYWNSAERKGYSGTAIFSKIKPLAVGTNFPDDLQQQYDLNDDYGNPDREGRVLTAEYGAFYLVTVYTPNSKNDLSRLSLRHKSWDPAFLAYVQRLRRRKPVIICGDMNVAHTEMDLARPKENVGEHGFTVEERSGFDDLLKAGFIDTFRMFTQGNGHYSWWTHWGKARERNVGWRIDYFLVSAELKQQVVAADIHADVMGSDHCPVSLTLKVS